MKRVNLIIFVSPPFAKAGDIKTHSSVRLFVTKTLIWLISSKVLMIEHWYLACMIFVTSPFNWHRAVTLTFDLLEGQSCCRGDHNSLNLPIWGIKEMLYYGLSLLLLYLSWGIQCSSLCCLCVCIFHPDYRKQNTFKAPPLKKIRNIALHMSVGMFASLPDLVQQKTHWQGVSNLVGTGRYSFIVE